MSGFRDNILGFADVISKWQKAGSDIDSALTLTYEQLEGLSGIVRNDEWWLELQKIITSGRSKDSWLASDWPSGFDELVICAPLCRLVEWECSKCTVGRRQQNLSCANDNSLFGYIGFLAVQGNRTGLAEHIELVKSILRSLDIYWDPAKRVTIDKT